MTATLVKSPLRMTPSMTRAEDDPATPVADNPNRPLAYLYSSWEPGTRLVSREDAGHYDHESQTWVTPEGSPVSPIQAGVATRTRVDRVWPWGWISYDTDDVCS